MFNFDNIRLRGARDRLVDLLKIAQTYPLRDLEVRGGGLTVPVGDSAVIPITPSQPDVNYEPLDPHGKLVTTGQTGTGEVLYLTTPPIEEDITFRILARKADVPREAYLHATAAVKVGLDATLEAAVCDPSTGTAVDLVSYGETVAVKIRDAQEGVAYRLVVPAADGGESELSGAVIGKGVDRQNELLTRPLAADTTLRIRATKTFDAEAGRQPQTRLLDVELPVKVRPNPGLEVSAASPIVGFGDGCEILISDSEASVAYQLWARRLEDHDFVYGETDARVLRVAVKGEADARVLSPPPSSIALDVAEAFEAQGEPRAGNGGVLSLTLAPPADDVMVLVRARKEHADGTVSGVLLDRAAAILVRPDPLPELRFEVWLAGKTVRRPVRGSGGQPGVFYSARRGQRGVVRGPVYIHRVDPIGGTNVGLGRLRVEGDLVVSRERFAGEQIADEVAGRPLPPLLEVGKLPVDSTLEVRAVKARTRVAAALSKTIDVPSLPPIQLSSTTVDFGAPVRVQVAASREGEVYQVVRDGRPVGEARPGTGEDLTFELAPIGEDTTFEVHVVRTPEPGLPVTRIVVLEVTVKDSAP